MYRILCFGDSNTWGYNPVNGLRLSPSERWPGVLQQRLGQGFQIFEDGRNGRRIFETGDELNSSEELVSSLNINDPLDVVIIFLGINDLLFENETNNKKPIDGTRMMIEKVKNVYRDTHGVVPEIILISAVPINELQVKELLYEQEAEKILRFGNGLRQLAEEEGCGFIDSGRIIRTSEEDGVHIEALEHQKLGSFIAEYIRSFLSSGNFTNRGY